LNSNWMPREKWEALVRGENCPLCIKENDDDFGYAVADMSINRLILMKNQYVAGYCVLICHKHVREPYELTEEEQQKFFNDMMNVGKSLESVYKADKMNFQILGNSVPHLHCHIEPRYYGDSSPGRPIDPNSNVLILDVKKYEKRIKQIRDALDVILIRQRQRKPGRSFREYVEE
jgi:diadenosine tetraphosphate (Ap4A) HIT family hydrolase